jgi:DNA-directed RNA polymerase sigma subunit (sigma70/sigma32)
MGTKENDILDDYLQSLYGIEPLTTKEEHELAKHIANGEDWAIDKLVTHNLRFVVYLVSKMTAWQYGKVPVEDMIGLGNEALLKAATRWQPKNNAKFATYAKNFILKDVRRELDNTANIIRLPIHIMEQIKRLNYNDRALTQLLGRRPTTAELSQLMKMPQATIGNLRGYINQEPVSIDNNNQENFTEEHDE